jgi:hypothetical protein
MTTRLLIEKVPLAPPTVSADEDELMRGAYGDEGGYSFFDGPPPSTSPPPLLPPPAFPKMPILYLELIENKRKVRSDLLAGKPASAVTVVKQQRSVDAATPSSQRPTGPSGPGAAKGMRPEGSRGLAPLHPPPTTIGFAGGQPASSSTEARPVDDAGEDRGHGGAEAPGGDGGQPSASGGAAAPPIGFAAGVLRGRKDPSDAVDAAPTEPPLPPLPPTLEELRAREAHDSGAPTSTARTDEDEARRIRRQDAYYHYQVLKRMHPNVDIPEFTIWSDPDVMEPQYDMMFKKLSLDASIDSWKRYMIGALMIFEILLGKLNFDMEGFAHQQIISMPTYDALIVELAEKSYVPKGSRWPVELRLLAMILANSALFIGTKIIAKRTGTNLLGTINRMTNPTYDERVMRGPNVGGATNAQPSDAMPSRGTQQQQRPGAGAYNASSQARFTADAGGTTYDRSHPGSNSGLDRGYRGRTGDSSREADPSPTGAIPQDPPGRSGAADRGAYGP